MKNFLTAFIVFMVWSLFGLWIYSWLQPKNDAALLLTNNREEIPMNPKKEKNNIIVDTTEAKQIKIITEKDSILEKNNQLDSKFKAINSDGDIIFYFEETINITKNKAEINIPKSSIDYKYKINTYLLEHPNKEVHIQSIYSPLEDVVEPNFGIQRALEIEKQLVEIGITKEKIVKKSIIKNINFSEENSYNNGIYFNFKKLDTARVNAIKKKIPASKFIYPNFTESGISVNNELKLLLSDLLVYFNEHPNKTITIVGHTDNIGNANDNYTVGLKYSKQIKWYLVSKGDLKKTSIIAISKGESEPIDDNNSKQGRITNRRIEVIYN